MSIRYALENEDFVIRNFDHAPPFSSFLPGIAGIKGIPLWSFYSNRGQAITSFGVNNKANAIMEFNPANTSYENVALKGYRTFLSIDGAYTEPFSPLFEAARDMRISENTLTITEENNDAGYVITVTYFILPSAPLGALIRRVCLTSTRSGARAFGILDGLPKIIPFGVQLGAFKEMSNLMKSWTDITNIDNNAPMYAMRASSDDSAEVKRIKGGYFYLAVCEGETARVIYDPDTVFGFDTSLQRARAFEAGGLEGVLSSAQCFANKIPCAFTPITKTLCEGESVSFFSAAGYAASQALINDMAGEMKREGYIERKYAQARALTGEYTRDVLTVSGSKLFDQYVRQCYLDNFLRGGYPYVMNEGARKRVIHLFSRKHGDPERDYNFFTTSGEYFSQGNGNFRDVCQNRRNDVSINPDVGDFNIYTFLSLIQMDGYNPLEIRPATFHVPEDARARALEILARYIDGDASGLESALATPFTPGMLLSSITARGLSVRGDECDMVAGIAALSEQRIEAGFGEGYWSDHFDYCLDLIEDYLSVFPDKASELFFGREDYRYYDSVAVVRPRRDTYVSTERGVRQYGSVFRDPEKAARPGFDVDGANWQKYATGEYVMTSLFGKLFTLVVTKFALLDPEGMGVEMDGGKPGWCDAMNGLPGLMGSGMPETLELRRLLDALIDACPESGEIILPKELVDFALALDSTCALDGFERWDAAATLREEYRRNIRMCLSGARVKLEYAHIRQMLARFTERVNNGVSAALKAGDGVMPTYFTYEPTRWELLLDETGKNVVLSPYGLPAVSVKAFKRHTLPVFLEGPARMLAASRPDERADMALMASKLKRGGLYDKKLNMFRTSEPLDGLSMETGRILAFTPGWLERESVFLHMEYKYFLGLFKAELYDEFFDSISRALIPFLDPGVYARSVLENSSFIASSANPDPDTHGRGYVARLSGSTTEVISMWLNMFVGKGFTTEGGELVFRLTPVLPDWLFTERGEAEFTLFKRTQVKYVNPARKPTYGEGGARVSEIVCHYADGHTVRVSGGALASEHARALRAGRIERVEARLA